MTAGGGRAGAVAKLELGNQMDITFPSVNKLLPAPLKPRLTDR